MSEQTSKRVYETWPRRLYSMNSDRMASTSITDIPERVMLPVLNRAVGVEIEVERAAGARPPRGWQIVADGSLRDHGIEFVTEYGTRLSEIHDHVTRLQKVLPKGVSFSPRTSVHMHMDVRYFPVPQLEALLILYVIFEDALFGFAGPERKSNVFCVPFRYTKMPEILQGGLVPRISRLRENQKYCAFNLAAIPQKGTVEFRHMSGNCDPERIQKWALILGLMLQYARRVKLPDLHERVNKIKCSSQYDEFKKEVFYRYGDELTCDPASVDEALSEAKLLFDISKRN